MGNGGSGNVTWGEEPRKGFGVGCGVKRPERPDVGIGTGRGRSRPAAARLKRSRFMVCGSELLSSAFSGLRCRLDKVAEGGRRWQKTVHGSPLDLV